MLNNFSMKNKVFFIVIFLLALNNSIYSYDCKKMNIDEARALNYENNDVIFIGKVIKTDKTLFTFKVIEVFKGKSDTIYQVQINSNLNINLGDKCLIYAHYQNESKNLIINECSISRSFCNPVIFNIYDIPHPPLNFEEDEDKFNNSMKLLQLQSKIDLVEEVSWLRGKRIMALVQNNEKILNRLTNYFIYVSLLFLILIIFLLFKRVKKVYTSN